MSLSTLGKIGMADKLSVAQLQQAVKAGSIPAYIGIPLIQEKVKAEQEMKSAQAAQNTPQNSVAEQVMAQATQQEMSGLGDLPTNLPEQYAAGGIIGYDEGGDVTQEEYDEAIEDAEFNKYAQAMLNRTPSVEKGLRNAPTAMSYGQVQGQNLRAAHAAEAPKSDHKYADTVLKYAEQYGVDPKLALHVLNKETGGMKNPETAKSKAGAQGIMQIMPATAKDLGIKDPMDPEQSAEGGVRYLSKLRGMVGDDPRLIAAAYNAGPGNVRKHGGVPPFAETQNYVKGLAEGGITDIEGDPDYVMYDGIRTKRSLLDESADSPWNTVGTKNIYASTDSEGSDFIDDLKTGAGKTAAAAADVVSYLPRKAFKGINSLLGTNIPTTESDTPFYDKYYRDEEKAATPTAAPEAPRAAPGTPPVSNRYRDEGSEGIAKTAPGVTAAATPKPKEGGGGTTTEKPAEKSSWQSLRDLIDERKAERKAQKDQDLWMALMAGGLGAMSGTSQYAGVNIGQGAMHGLQQYGTARREAGKEEAADIKNLANIARFEGMDKYYSDELQRKLEASKGAQDQKEYVAANNVINSVKEERMAEMKQLYGNKPEMWDPETTKKVMDYVGQSKLDPRVIDAERRLKLMQGYTVLRQKPAA